MYHHFFLKNNVIFIIKCICILWISTPSSLLFADLDPLPVRCVDDQLIINIDQYPLRDLIQLLHHQCGITISGLKIPEDYPVSYQGEGPVLQIMKRLLRVLESESYVFEFKGNHLSHITIFSRGKTKYSLPAPEFFKHQSNVGFKRINAVKVLEIVPGSQAEVYGFQKDDYIVEYDSVAIHSASQLVSEVQKKKNLQRVDIVIIRNKSRLSYVINSGLIGVRIQTVKVEENDIK
jgi:hypothetical protein